MSRSRSFAVASVSLVVALCASTPTHAGAQSYRGWAGTSVQMIELRPFGLDTVPRAEVVTDAQGRFSFGGLAVTCVTPDVCTGYVPLSQDRTFAASQDLSLTFWGFGVEGLSLMTLVRGRARLGGEALWPRQDDEFDAILAYLQLSRGAFRIRAGRQDLRTGLGFTGFDGVSGSMNRGRLSAEAYAGLSLSRGLREPANEALRGLDDFVIDYGTYLMGGAVTVRHFGTLLTSRYHREILSDRSGYAGERASVDFTTVLPRMRVSGGVDYDFSFEQVGKGHLTVSAPFADGHWLMEVTARRYIPYFELSTIWGFFEPVSYSEIMGRVSWSPSAQLGLRVAGGWRTYGDTRTAVVFQPLTDDGRRFDASATYPLGSAWVLDGRYQLEWGPGAFLSTGDLSARYLATERLTASATATSFQQIEEYRLGDGRAFGAGVSVDYRYNPSASVSGGGSILRHSDGEAVFTSPWNQSRAWMALRFDIGSDPGLANRRGRR